MGPPSAGHNPFVASPAGRVPPEHHRNVGELAGAPTPVADEHGGDRCGEVLGHRGRHGGERGRPVTQQVQGLGHGGTLDDGAASREALVEDRADGPDVGALVDVWIAARLLERHVAQRAEGFSADDGGPNGQRVLDIGCGAGSTTLLAADRVTPGGLAIGVDIDPDAIQRGRQRAAGARRHQVSFVLADAGVHAFEPRGADAIISRFGTLHFSNPEAAFANLERATKTGGRLAMLCARPLADNLWARLPLLVLRRFHAEAGALALERAASGGPFTLAREERLRHVLEAGGWREIRLRTLQADLWVGEDVEATLAFFDASDGPKLRRALGGAYLAFREALGESLGPYQTDDGVRLPGAAWLASAVSWGEGG